MKHKIILLFLFLFCFTGCYDYKELNELAIVTGMGLDLVQDDYYVTVQIIEPNKVLGEGTEASTPKILEGQGKTISDALHNVNKKIPKELYLSNLDILVVSKELIEKKKDFLNFFIMNTVYHMNPLIVLSDRANDIFTFEKNKEYNATTLKSMLHNTYDRTGEASFLTVTDIFEKKEQDTIIPKVSIVNDNLVLDQNYAIKDNTLAWSLSSEEIFSYNLVKGKIENAMITESLNDEYYSFRISKEHASIKATLKNSTPKVTIDVYVKVNLSENNTFKVDDTFKKRLEHKISTRIQLLCEQMKQKKIDLFAIGDLYHKYQPKYYRNLKDWYDTFSYLEIDVFTHLKLDDTIKEEGHA